MNKKDKCIIKIPGGDRQLCSIHGWVATKEELRHATQKAKELEKQVLKQSRLYESLKLLKDSSEFGKANLKQRKSELKSLKAKYRYALAYLTELKNTVMKNGVYFHDMKARWDGLTDVTATRGA